MMKLFDFHCDTAYRMDRERLSPFSPKLHINTRAVSTFEEVGQVFAFFCDKNEDDQTAFLSFERTYKGFRRKWKAFGSRLTPLFSVEDGRLLCYDLTRLSYLYRLGIRIFTPLWSKKNSLGCAHNCQSDTALTTFGVAACMEAMRLGMLCDISHASPGSAEELISLARHMKKPILATHSAFSSVCPHTRCLTDRIAEQIRNSGGIIGLPLVPSHLAPQNADIDDIIAHIRHAYSIGCRNCLCLGCDFDGTGELPLGIEGLASLPKLAKRMSEQGFSDKDIECLFYQNAKHFFAEHAHQYIK